MEGRRRVMVVRSTTLQIHSEPAFKATGFDGQGRREIFIPHDKKRFVKEDRKSM